MGCGEAAAEKSENRFPDCFPSNFQEDILPKNLKPLHVHVFRICKYGSINKQAFLSTFEEVKLGLRPPGFRWEKQLNDPGTYSTSCNTDLQEILGVLDHLQGYHPQAILCQGDATSDLGPLQLTSERIKRPTNHVDWWLYKDSDPSQSFAEVSEE